MPSEFRHFSEYRLVIERFYGAVTVDDVVEITNQYLALSEQVDTTLTILADLRSVEKYPASINQLRQALRVIPIRQIGWVVILINDNPLMKMAAAVLTQVSIRGARFRLFESPADALGFIESLDGQSRQALPLNDEVRHLLS
jgi:hypothetical protein